MEHGLIGWLFIIVALIFIFGGRKRLEDLGGGFGGFMREFNKARAEGLEKARQAAATESAPVPAAKGAVKKAAKRPSKRAPAKRPAKRKAQA